MEPQTTEPRLGPTFHAQVHHREVTHQIQIPYTSTDVCSDSVLQGPHKELTMRRGVPRDNNVTNAKYPEHLAHSTRKQKWPLEHFVEV